jgi:hypothetical protein
MESPARKSGRGGAPQRVGSVPVLPTRARPDEGVAVAVLVVEQVGVNRRVERGIVQLDREVVAALGGPLRPGRPDLGAADVDPMAGGVVGGPAGLGDDADVLGLNAEGDDLALELAVDLLEGTDAGHVTSPWLSRARDHRGLDGDRSAGGDRRRTRRAGAQRRMAAVRVSCLTRNGLQPKGRKSIRRRCVPGDRGAPSFGQIKPGRGRVVRAPNSILRRRGAHVGCPQQEAGRCRRKKRNPGVQRQRLQDPPPVRSGTPTDGVSVSARTKAYCERFNRGNVADREDEPPLL